MPAIITANKAHKQQTHNNVLAACCVLCHFWHFMKSQKCVRLIKGVCTCQSVLCIHVFTQTLFSSKLTAQLHISLTDSFITSIKGHTVKLVQTYKCVATILASKLNFETNSEAVSKKRLQCVSWWRKLLYSHIKNMLILLDLSLKVFFLLFLFIQMF